MAINSFVGDELLKDIFYLSAEEAVKYPEYDKYIGVVSEAIKDEETSLMTIEGHLIGIAMTATLRRKIIEDLKGILEPFEFAKFFRNDDYTLMEGVNMIDLNSKKSLCYGVIKF